MRSEIFTRPTAQLVDPPESAPEWLPPASPADGWAGLFHRSLDTVQMSLLAIAIGGMLAVLAAFVAARDGETSVRRAVAGVARLALLITRAIPPPVWALLGEQAESALSGEADSRSLRR